MAAAARGPGGRLLCTGCCGVTGPEPLTRRVDAVRLTATTIHVFRNPQVRHVKHMRATLLLFLGVLACATTYAQGRSRALRVVYLVGGFAHDYDKMPEELARELKASLERTGRTAEGRHDRRNGDWGRTETRRNSR